MKLIFVLLFAVSVYFVKCDEIFEENGNTYYIGYPEKVRQCHKQNSIIIYKKTRILKMNWHMAQRLCQINNRRLVEIDSEAKQREILNVIRELKVKNASTKKLDFWIGLTNFGIKLGANETHYFASSGRYLTTYHNFDTEHFPANQCVIQTENFKGHILWQDTFCSDDKYYICENDSEKSINDEKDNSVDNIQDNMCSLSNGTSNLRGYLTHFLAVYCLVVVFSRLNE